MMKKILLAALVVVVLFAAYVATRPAAWRVERSGVVAAPPSEVYPRVADFRRWDAWSPWANLDPTMKTDFGGQQGSPGATYHWVGNDKVGEGRMTILSASPDGNLSIRLEFIKPIAQLATTDMRFDPVAGGTKVTWSMYGTYNFLEKLVSVFMDMDKVVGGDFEKGLEKMARTQPR